MADRKIFAGARVRAARGKAGLTQRELARRLGGRAVDHRRLLALSPAARLPAIEAGAGLDPEALRARIAEGLVDWLARGGAGEKEEG